MNYTKSGIIAEGAPMSKVRLINEANLAIGLYDYNHHILFATDEGFEIINKFLSIMGCDGSMMTSEAKSEYLIEKGVEFHCFLLGIKFASTL